MTATEPPTPAATESNAAPAGPTAEDHRALQLENALLKAGVDLNTDQGKLIARAWTGQNPEVEAIAREWELVKPAPVVVEAPPPEPERLEGEGGQAAERGALASSVVVEPNPEDKDPRTEAVLLGTQALTPRTGQPAGTHMDAMAVGVHTLMEAASRGDSRVLAVDHGQPGF